MTVWKKINGYANFSVSDSGQVRNDKTGRIYKTWLDTNGYPSLHLGKDIRRVHKLVAEAFIPNSNNLPEVNHIDGNKHTEKNFFAWYFCHSVACSSISELAVQIIYIIKITCCFKSF